jgi:hypothetical protein
MSFNCDKWVAPLRPFIAFDPQIWAVDRSRKLGICRFPVSGTQAVAAR